MTTIDGVQFREASASDVPAMMLCHDAEGPPADHRMAGYFNREHHPQKALLPRVGYVALVNGNIVGYIAGHRTTRHGCGGEVQYLFVSPKFRRRGIAREMLRLLAEWFGTEGIQHVCVALADDSPPQAKPFYVSVGAAPLKKYWYAWQDIGIVRR
jgi:GNAT superfamily N-acetyltransferase